MTSTEQNEKLNALIQEITAPLWPSLIVRPSEDTMPCVTLERNPSGLPIAKANWPTCSVEESPNAAGVIPKSAATQTVMAALGAEEGGAVVTRGWYRVEAGKCLRPELRGQARRG